MPVLATKVDGKPLGTGESVDQATPPGTKAEGVNPTGPDSRPAEKALDAQEKR